MKYTTNQKLRLKRGASVTEFVVIAPILLLLCMIAYELNHHLEEAQNVEVLTHNAVYSGTGEDSTNTLQISADSEQELNDEHKNRALQPSGIALVGGNFSSFYGESTQALNTALPAANAVIDAYNTSFSVTGMHPSQATRIAAVEMTSNDQSSGITKAIDALSRIFNKNDVPPNAPKFSSRRYLLSKTAYHPEDYKQSVMVGAVVGVASYGDWSGGEFDRKGRKMQERCMTKLSAEDTCETGHGRRKFLNGIKSLALARLAISYILTATVVGGAVEQAATPAIQTLINGALDKAAGGVYDELEGAIVKNSTDVSSSAIKKVQDTATNGLKTFGQDIAPGQRDRTWTLGE